MRIEVISLLSEERLAYEERFHDATLSRPAYLELTTSVSERLTIFDELGLAGLEQYRMGVEKKLAWHERLLFRLRSHWADRLLANMVIRLEVLLHASSALEAVAKSTTPGKLRNIYDHWAKETRAGLHRFYQFYPHYSAAAQAQVISNAAYAISMQTLNRMLRAGVTGATRIFQAQATDRAQTQGDEGSIETLASPIGILSAGQDPHFQILATSHSETIGRGRSSPRRGYGQVDCKSGGQEALPFCLLWLAWDVSSSKESSSPRARISGPSPCSKTSLKKRRLSLKSHQK